MKFGQRVHAEQNQQKNLKKPRSPKSTAKTLGGRSTLEAVHVDAVPIVSQAPPKKICHFASKRPFCLQFDFRNKTTNPPSRARAEEAI